MVFFLQKLWAWMAYRLIRAYWWIRRPIVLGVRVLVADGDRVLLVKHSYRNGWFLPGGTPKRGESLDVTACREVREETGTLVSDATLLGMYSSLGGYESNHIAIFLVEVRDTETDGNEKTAVGSGRSPEVEDVRWVQVKHPPQGVSDQTSRILRDCRNALTCTYSVAGKSPNQDTRT